MKKPSAASATPKPPEPPVFFLDASLGRKVIAEALRQAGEQVIVHDERFDPGTKDEVWLAEAGNQGWVVLTKDDKIRYHPIERQALLEARVAAIILPKGNVKAEEMAKAFVAALPKIKRLLRRETRPFIYRLSAGGTLTKVAVSRT